MRVFLASVLCCFAAACSVEPVDPDAGEVPKRGSLIVYATSYPLAYFAERLGGSLVEVVFPAPRGVDPAHWVPDRETIARAQHADLLLRSGAGDPAWLALVSLHRDRVVDTTANVRDRLLEQETVRHQHGPAGQHSHGAWAGTTWLDPTLAAAQARAVAEALALRQPGDAARFEANLELLVGQLQQLDAEQTMAAERLGDTPLLYSHPVYAYLQARYALNGRSVVWEPDEMPTEAQWRELRELQDEHPARTMLWEAAPLPEVAERLAALGVEVRVYAPSANRPGTGDWLSVMRTNLSVLEALAKSAAGPAAVDRTVGSARP
jgi:zinc transport system substrate-binding protein